MTEVEDMRARFDALRRQLRELHGVRARDLGQAMRRSKLFLPRHVRKAGLRLAEAERLLGHPKLERMVDFDAVETAHKIVSDHLKTVDRADLRRGRLLGIAGAMAVNVILVAVLFAIWAHWVGQQ